MLKDLRAITNYGLSDIGRTLIQYLDPETAHNIALAVLKMGLAPKDGGMIDPILQTDLAGLALPHPIGLAAGFDKNAIAALPLLQMGFSFIECGTVTPRPQAGNAKPRLFRLQQDKAIINRMGFNNQGLEKFQARLLAMKGLSIQQLSGIIAANIGANKDSDDKIQDYINALQSLWSCCSYFTINISSPNTQGLRGLQTGQAFENLIARISEKRQEMIEKTRKSPPIFLKIAPDLDDHEVEKIVSLSLSASLSGLIISNTTLARPKSLMSPYREESGGLSGAPLREASYRLLSLCYRLSQAKLCLIGVGGISNAEDAYARIKAGASALQIYTAFVYRGPRLIDHLRKGLTRLLKRDGFSSLSEAIGHDAKSKTSA